MEELRAWYRESLAGYADAMGTAILALRSGNQEASQSLRRMAHRLRGSAGSYGYERLGRLAGVMEDAARTLIETIVGDKPLLSFGPTRATET